MADFKKMKQLFVSFILWQETLGEIWKGVRYAEPVERWRAPVEYAQECSFHILSVELYQKRTLLSRKAERSEIYTSLFRENRLRQNTKL